MDIHTSNSKGGWVVFAGVRSLEFVFTPPGQEVDEGCRAACGKVWARKKTTTRKKGKSKPRGQNRGRFSCFPLYPSIVIHLLSFSLLILFIFIFILFFILFSFTYFFIFFSNTPNTPPWRSKNIHNHRTHAMYEFRCCCYPPLRHIVILFLRGSCGTVTSPGTQQW